MKILLIIGIIIVLLVLFYFVRKGGTAKEGITDIKANEAAEMIKDNKSNKNFVILDVRTPGEFISGHIAGAKNLDYHSSGFDYSLDTLDKSKTYLVYCRSGNRSSHASNLMKTKGFANLLNLQGGIMTWSGATQTGK